MEAGGLRIGNYVLYNGVWGRIWAIMPPLPYEEERLCNKYLIELECNGLITVPVDEVEGISLTEELMEKCGFKRIDHIYGYSFFTYNRKNIQCCSFDVYLNCNMIKIGGYPIANHFKYLHELQNLFYAMNRNELRVAL